MPAVSRSVKKNQHRFGNSVLLREQCIASETVHCFGKAGLDLRPPSQTLPLSVANAAVTTTVWRSSDAEWPPMTQNPPLAIGCNTNRVFTGRASN